MDKVHLLVRESSFAREDHEVVLIYAEQTFPPGATNMTSKAIGELRLNHIKLLIFNHCDL